MEDVQSVSISPLLERLSSFSKGAKVEAVDVAAAISLILSGRVSPVQIGSLLSWLSATGLDHNSDVLAESAKSMTNLASPVDYDALRQVTSQKRKPEGSYEGGLVSL
jgi:anthranilate phosphoribosyltransferase